MHTAAAIELGVLLRVVRLDFLPHIYVCVCGADDAPFTAYIYTSIALLI